MPFASISGIIFLVATIWAYIATKDMVITLAAVGFTVWWPMFGFSHVLDGKSMANHPEKLKWLKKSPQMYYDMADVLFKDIIYEDEDVILSKGAVANARNLSQIAYTKDVFLVYKYQNRARITIVTFTTAELLVLLTAGNPVIINIKKKTGAGVLADTILSVCPNAKAGYTKEGLEYANMMKQNRS